MPEEHRYVVVYNGSSSYIRIRVPLDAGPGVSFQDAQQILLEYLVDRGQEFARALVRVSILTEQDIQ